jgi:hypothetical protein
LVGPVVKPAERQLMQMLVEAEEFRERLAHEILEAGLHRGLETERIFEVLISKAAEKPDPAMLSSALEEKDRRLLFEILFDSSAESTWEAAESCLSVLRNRRVEQDLAELQKQIEAKPSSEDLRRLMAEKDKLRRQLAES